MVYFCHSIWGTHQIRSTRSIKFDLDDRDVARTLTRVQVWPINLAVARVSTNLDFEGDPADEIIAATSIVYNVPLLTRDKVIRNSNTVPLVS